MHSVLQDFTTGAARIIRRMPKGRHIRTIRLEIPTARTWAGHWDCFWGLTGSALYNAPGSSCDFTWQEDAEPVKPPKDEHLMHRSGGPSGRPRPASAPARRIAGRDDRKGLSACLVLWMWSFGFFFHVHLMSFEMLFKVLHGFSARSAAINSDTSELKVLPWRKPCSAVSCNSNGHGW